MKKVIEHGYQKYTVICSRCGCHFSYELSDIKDDRVSCPDCSEWCIHDSSAWCCGSQVGGKDKDDYTKN